MNEGGTRESGSSPLKPEQSVQTIVDHKDLKIAQNPGTEVTINDVDA